MCAQHSEGFYCDQVELCTGIRDCGKHHTAQGIFETSQTISICKEKTKIRFISLQL